MRFLWTVMLLVLFALGLAYAGDADVIEAKAVATGGNTFRFDVTVLHQDEGWKHYADKYDVVAPDGTVLGTRVLHHPHVNEQPFTRSLSGINISPDIEWVTVRAHDSVHKYGGKVVKVKLSR